MILGHNVNYHFLIFLSLLSTIGFMLRASSYIYIKQNGDPLGILTDKLTKLLLISGMLSFPILVYCDKAYSSVFVFFTTISGMCLMQYAIERDRAMKLHTVTNVNSSLFTKDTKMNPVTNLERLLFVSVIIGVFFLLVGNYSQNIYPYLYEQYGGGKTSTVLLSTKMDSFKGRLLHRDTNRYYLLTSNDGLVIVESSEVRSISKGKLE